jgi:hypothetical protein
MLQSKFKKGDRVVGIDTSGVAHSGVIETVWRRLGDTVYGVLFDEISERLLVIEDDLCLESEYVVGKDRQEDSER